jgi:hypothetical protein
MMTDVVIAALGTALIAALGSCASAAIGLLNRNKLGEVHSMVDGRLTSVMEDLASAREDLRKLTEKASFAEGKKEENDLRTQER